MYDSAFRNIQKGSWNTGAILYKLSKNPILATLVWGIEIHTYKYPQMGLLNFCATCCKAWTRSIHSWAYAHKHMLCSSVTKSLRDAASVCIASDAL